MASTAHPRLALGTVLVLAAACTHSDNSLVPRPLGIDRTPHLTYASDCARLETAIEDAVVLAMRSELELYRTGGWNEREAAADGAAGGNAAPTSYTTTNSQVSGVSEADFVQNDGTRIAVLTGGAFHLVKSWPPDALQETGSLAIEGWPREFFLVGDQAIVFSTTYVPRAIEGSTTTAPCMALDVAGSGPSGYGCGYYGSNVTKITTVSLANPASLAVTSEIYLPGSYLSARRIDERVRVVLSDSLPYPEGVTTWPGYVGDMTDAEREAAFTALASKNEASIRSRTLDDWLRRGSVKARDGSTRELGYTCSDFALSSSPSRPGVLTVATVDLGSEEIVSRTALIAQADVVYASRETLYLTANHWWWVTAPGQESATYLHAFDLRDPDRAPYLGSGVVDGRVDDQYKLDEYGGALRVASTLTRLGENGAMTTSNQIAVLALSGGALQTIGKTDSFGPGETLFGTRFLGARGFAITARQIDPLFTFDLSDPAAPRVVGEVEMPGFISYLHPIDDAHLLGVGREPANGSTQVKVQLLDVTDMAAPHAGTAQMVGEGWSWSEALWDPKAFTWFGVRGLLAIPFQDQPSGGFVSDLRLFRVDPATGITALGSLSMADVYAEYAEGTYWTYYWSPVVRRSVMADDAGQTYVYAISDAGIRSAKIGALSVPLSTVRFERLGSQ